MTNKWVNKTSTISATAPLPIQLWFGWLIFLGGSLMVERQPPPALAWVWVNKKMISTAFYGRHHDLSFFANDIIP